MTQYRYLFADLLTNSIIGELPLTGVNFTQQLNSIGTLSGNLLLPGVNAAAMNVANATQPGRTAVYVDRDGVLVWGGVLWARPYSTTDAKLKFAAQEFESYLQRRVITADAVFSAVDQFTIAQSLVNTAQAASSGNIGITVGSNTCGVTASATFYGYERKNVYTALSELSKATGGFDFAIQVAYDGSNNPAKTLTLGYPRIGTAYSATSTTVPMIQFPGNAVSYELDEQGSSVANTVYAMGAGSNEGKAIGSASDATKLSAGWPLLEAVASYGSYTDTTLLANLAAGQLTGVSAPPYIFKVVVPPYVDPILGSYRVGDDVRLSILDDRFPTGLDAVYRLVGLTVTPGEDGPERATLTLSTGTV